MVSAAWDKDDTLMQECPGLCSDIKQYQAITREIYLIYFSLK